MVRLEGQPIFVLACDVAFLAMLAGLAARNKHPIIHHEPTRQRLQVRAIRLNGDRFESLPTRQLGLVVEFLGLPIVEACRQVR